MKPQNWTYFSCHCKIYHLQKSAEKYRAMLLGTNRTFRITVKSMILYHCEQGLIKNATSRVTVAQQIKPLEL